MAEERHKSWLERYFWGVALVVVVVVVAGAVLLLRGGQSLGERRDELNRNYVEKIDIKAIPDGGGGTRDLIVIDGRSRYDCSASNGKLTCSDDPKPTPAR